MIFRRNDPKARAAAAVRLQEEVQKERDRFLRSGSSPHRNAATAAAAGVDGAPDGQTTGRLYKVFIALGEPKR